MNTLMRLTVSVVAPLGVLTSSSAALAQQSTEEPAIEMLPPAVLVPREAAFVERAPPASKDARVARRWYGWQMLIGYAVSDALLAGGMSTHDDAVRDALFAAGLAGHGLTGPVVHLANGELARAAGSAALTTVPAGIGAGVVLGTANDHGLGGVATAGTAVAIGGFFVVAANIFDVSVLAYKDKERPTTTGLHVVPAVSPQQRGLVVAGAF